MTDAAHERLVRFFDRALELSGSARSKFLDDRCGDDAALRRRLEALLAAAESELIPATTPPPSPDAHAPLPEVPGSRIGPYQLLEQIGEGGFGVVFLAQQEKPVARQVALKIIKLGMDTRQVVARFEQERQALALMDHPNIARVLDAGATHTGRPYFVMDLVKGDPIVEYCDKHSLTIEARLELFAQVCNALQHAHSKGIIHRDIKPSNVLVATHDGRPIAKVIDFGIAKATSSKLTDKTLFTEHRAVIGTLQYMSPEQAEGSLDVDTRTDVYSLGVLLYELLTGSTPFEPQSLRDAALSEIQRIIREVEPPKPSTRLGDSRETLNELAARRRIDPKRLGSLVRGDLDWIVMKALEKDRARRYETASSLALDVARYLSGDAVVAAPPSASYRFRKFVRRNKATVAAASAVLLSLLAGLIAFAWQSKVAGEQRDIAQAAQRAEGDARRTADAQRDRAVVAEGQAQARADELQKVSDFQARMLGDIDANRVGRLLTEHVREAFAQSTDQSSGTPSEHEEQKRTFAEQWKRVNATDTARELVRLTLLAPSVTAIDTQFAEQPIVASQLRATLAELFFKLSLYDDARALHAQAYETRTRVLGADHLDTLNSLVDLGNAIRSQGKFDEAETVIRESVDRCRRALGADHRLTLLALDNLGFVLRQEAKFGEAESVSREVLERQQRTLGAEHPDTLRSIGNLAEVLHEEGKFEEAEPLYRDALARKRRVLGEEDRDTIASIGNLGYFLSSRGRFAEAEPFAREALEKSRRILGDDHSDTLAGINNLGFDLQYQGKLAEAEPYVRESMERYRRMLGDEHPDALTSMNNFALLLQDEGKFDEAERLLRFVADSRRRVLGPEHPHTLDSIGNLGRFLQTVGRLSEAEPLLREGLEMRRKVRGEDHPDTFVALVNLGVLLQAQHKLAEAEPLLVEAVEKCRRVLGPEQPNTLIATITLAKLRVEQHLWPEVIALLEPIEPAARQTFTGSNLRRFISLHVNLGRAHEALAHYSAAERSFLEARAGAVTASGETDRDTLDCTSALVHLYDAWHAAEPDRGHDQQAAEWRAKLAVNSPNGAETAGDAKH